MPARFTPVLCLIALIALAGLGSSASAQNIADVWPPGAVRGGKAAVRIEGSGLAGAKAVLVSGHGVKAAMGAVAADGNSIPLALEVAADAGPGPYEVRVVTPAGLSTPGYLWVGTQKEVEEKEPDDQPESAMKLDKLPVTVNGRVNNPEDVDWYQFHADAGETMVFDICSNRLFAPLDPFLELRDTENHLLGMAMEGYDRDPRLIHTFKKAGDYRIQVRDTLYRGGANFVYRLTLGKIPVITQVTPPGGRRGETLSASVSGVNLGGMTSATIPLPADMDEDRTRYTIVDTPNGPSLPFALFAGDMTQAVAPAGTAKLPKMVPPASLVARLSTEKEVHTIPLDLQAGKPYQIEVVARAAGSRMLPYARLLDPAGKELLNTEDQIGRDPRIAFTPPAAGTYQLEISTIDGKGGPDYYYRLAVRPPSTPDFRITASPDNLVLGKSQTQVVNVSTERRGGFGGPVAVTIVGLPAGVAASPLTLAPGQNSGILTLTAAPDAALGNGALHIVGEAVDLKAPDGKSAIRHEALVFANLPRPGEGQILPRLVRFQMATTTATVPLYTLTPETTNVTLAPGQSVTLKVRAGRRPNDNAALPAIALTLANLPPGVTAETPPIPEKQSEVAIKLTAAPTAGAGSSSALLTGKLGENNTAAAPAILITVKKQ
jgi:hypothetical protein